MKKSIGLLLSAFASTATLLSGLPGPVYSQGYGAPVPGGSAGGSAAGGQSAVQSAGVPGSGAPIPGAPAPNSGTVGGITRQLTGGYAQLPLSAADAQARIEDFRRILPDARPQEIQEGIYQLTEWLADMAEAHNKMAVAFAKHESTKSFADTERQTTQKFSQLKHQAELLKADLLIKQRRYPEALGPLVDIVSAEPTTATGQKAYKRLQQIGFSEEVEAPAPAVKAEITVSPAPPPEAPSNAQANNLSEPAVRQSHNTGTASQGSPVQAAVKVQSAGKAQVSGNPTPKVSAPAMSRTMSAPKKTLGTKKSTGGINKTVAVSKTKLRIATSTKANKSTHVSNNHAQAQSVWISGTPGGAH